MSWPSKTILPLSGVILPATRSNRVDLPATLGPIRPVPDPRFTCSEQLRTAASPPKLLLTFWTSITASVTRPPPKTQTTPPKNHTKHKNNGAGQLDRSVKTARERARVPPG